MAYLKARRGWSMVESKEGGGPAFLPGMAGILYHTVLTKAVGTPIYDLRADQFVERETGVVDVGGRELAVAEGRHVDVYSVFTKGVKALINSTQAQIASDVYTRAQASVAHLRRAVDDISLLRYLPGVCTICGRVEV